MRQNRPLGSDTPALPGLRTFIVPPDIVAVPRQSPVRVRKRTPWKPIVEGPQAVDRTGGRDWFGEHLSSQAARPRVSGVYAASIVINLAAVAGVSALMVSRQRTGNPQPHQPLFVSVALALGSPIVPEIDAPEPVAAKPARAESPRPKAEEPAVAIESAPAAPVEAPASIQPETVAPQPGPTGSAIGTPDGGEGVPSGTATGSGTAKGTGDVAQGPLRLGADIQPPKKVKDVKAVYPPEALAKQVRGTVVIEATISADGRVVDAVVRRSIPGLDQAALDAVRQWEYEPARKNGEPVAVIMTVTVAFAIL